MVEIYVPVQTTQDTLIHMRRYQVYIVPELQAGILLGMDTCLANKIVLNILCRIVIIIGGHDILV